MTKDERYAAQVNQPGWVCTECEETYPFEDPPLRRQCLRWEWYSGCGPGTDRPGKYRRHGLRCSGVRLSVTERQAIATAYAVGGVTAEEGVVREILAPYRADGYVGFTVLKGMLHRGYGYGYEVFAPGTVNEP